MSDRVTISLADGVADVRLNRADKMNALDTAMFEGLVSAGRELAADPKVRAVVLSGNGGFRDHTGLDEAVSRYVLNQAGARTFIETYARLITATAPGFEREGKRYLTVAVGCTGGKHRSVAIAEELSRRLRDLRVVVATQHRDLGRE